MNLLFTCAGRRNYLIQYFKEALKGSGLIVATDNQSSAPALVESDIAITVSDIYSDNYLEELKIICRDHKISAIISLNDLELPILSECKEDFEAIGTKVIISDKHIIEIAFDKWLTYEFLKSNGFLTPRTFISVEEAKLAMLETDLVFPLVLKPRWGSASIGIEIVENVKELTYAYELLRSKLSRSILGTVSSKDLDHSIILQEKIEADEYGLDVLNDFQGNYSGTYARKKISMRAGETDKALSVKDVKIERLGKQLSKALKHVGNLDCDIFIKGEKIYVLEFNPRFGGGYPFSHEAGVNSAAIYLAWLRGEKNVERFINYKPGLAFAKCERLISIPWK
ncbi:carbamoyl-phosphate synthase large subunit [Muriicola jejuensis]|uniref:ATP-grasp domain-containing protein n=1 Tax=Muriicola jejuensis TaxID=504488 RepID=A0A6P0UE96_9FLAO|nr:ATP-grasp domain-containing protein [Muriicola jejuensis]NER11545.1 ATP-grasp domain-containing protein [Muriicola jejuensis]SMP19762.1 carbamoyl-phosphate synthase large subunit [Muriicola jejuensis]